jgi:hypothetical protein
MPHPPIPGFPHGWKVLELHRSTNFPRDAVVLCERTSDSAQADSNYVTWSVNMIEGGCYCGNYWDSYEKARADYGVRKANLR